MKKLSSILLSAAMIITTGLSLAEGLEKSSLKITFNKIRIYLMDENENQLPVYEENGHFYVPIDSLIPAIGGTYNYDADTKMATIELATGTNSGSSGEKKITQEVFDSAKLAYQKLVNVSNETANIMDDVYNAWYYGIYEKKNATWYDFCSNLHLSSTEMEEGVKAHYLYQWLGNGKSVSSYFSSQTSDDDFWQYCVQWVILAYQKNGKYDSLSAGLAAAKDALKVVGDQFSDYQYYPNLKNFYAKASSYYDFAANPSGSFEQLKDTINDYENNLRTFITDLSFVFE